MGAGSPGRDQLSAGHLGLDYAATSAACPAAAPPPTPPCPVHTSDRLRAINKVTKDTSFAAMGARSITLESQTAADYIQ